MPKPKMTAAALARCRSMTIEYLDDRNRVHLQVFDPKRPGKPVASSIVRTPQDMNRYKRSWMQLYRIPEENITVIKVEVTPAEDVENARGTDKVSPEVHEHRKEVLGSDEGGDDGPPKKMLTVVPRQARRVDP